MNKRIATIFILVAFGAGCAASSNPPVAATPTVFQDATGSIKVTNMSAGQVLPDPFVIKGEAVAFESTFQWRVTDRESHLIAGGTVMANQPDAGIPGPFTINGTYGRTPTSATGTLTLFEASAKDGSEIHVVNIPVRFK